MAEDNKKVTCPLCGSDQYVENDLDEDVKDAFLESMLGGVPFTRTYDIMGGKLAVTVKAMDDESNRIRARLYIKIATAAEKFADLKAYIPLLESAMDVDSQITKVVINGTEISRDTDSGTLAVSDMPWDIQTDDTDWHMFVEDAMKMFEDCAFGKVKVPAAILRGVVAKHNILIGRLVKACLDENFLGGTGR